MSSGGRETLFLGHSTGRRRVGPSEADPNMQKVKDEEVGSQLELHPKDTNDRQ